MKNYLYTLLLFCILTPSLGQTIDKKILSSSSSDYNNNSYSISWSIGEVVVNKKNELSVGFHATAISIEEDSSTLLSKKDGITVNFSLYPNPTNHFVHISSTADSYQNYRYRLYSITGELIEHNKINQSDNRIDLSNKTSGIYLLKIFSEKNQNPIQSFKIIKK